MTVGSVPASGSAQIKQEPPDEFASVAPRPVQRPDRLGPVHVAQLVIAEVVVIGVLAVVGRGPWLVAAAGAVGLLVLAVLLTRRQGRWLLEWAWLQLRRRRRVAGGVATGPDPRIAALRSLAPALEVTDVDTAEGVRVGVANDDAGWYAVAVITSASAMGGDARPALPLDTMVTVLADAEQPGAVLQVVTHTVPPPGLVEPVPQVPASQSYQELVAQFGPGTVPLDQTTWVAVRLERRTLAELGVAAGSALDSAPGIVAVLIRRVAKSLRRTGVQTTVLDAGGLIGALARSCDLEEVTAGGPGPREEWSSWHSPRLAHRSFWLRDWPPLSHAAPLLEWLTTVPAAASNLSLTLAPAGDDADVALRCLLRVAAPAGDLERLCQRIQQGGEQVGAALFPLDGEQGPAVYASAPTGGGPQ